MWGLQFFKVIFSVCYSKYNFLHAEKANISNVFVFFSCENENAKSIGIELKTILILLIKIFTRIQKQDCWKNIYSINI